MPRRILLAVLPAVLLLAAALAGLAAPARPGAAAATAPYPALPHHHPQVGTSTLAQRQQLAAAVSYATGHGARSGTVRTPYGVLSFGPRQCEDSVRGDGMRKTSYCVKVYGLHGSTINYVFGATDWHNYAWRPGVGWIDYAFPENTLEYTRLWGKTAKTGYVATIIFTWGADPPSQGGCWLYNNPSNQGCERHGATSFTLISIQYDIQCSIPDLWKTGNYLDAHWTDDQGNGHQVATYLASDWTGFN